MNHVVPATATAQLAVMNMAVPAPTVFVELMAHKKPHHMTYDSTKLSPPQVESRYRSFWSHQAAATQAHQTHNQLKKKAKTERDHHKKKQLQRKAAREERFYKKEMKAVNHERKKVLDWLTDHCYGNVTCANRYRRAMRKPSKHDINQVKANQTRSHWGMQHNALNAAVGLAVSLLPTLVSTVLLVMVVL